MSLSADHMIYLSGYIASFIGACVWGVLDGDLGVDSEGNWVGWLFFAAVCSLASWAAVLLVGLVKGLNALGQSVKKARRRRSDLPRRRDIY